ncbi:MAG: Ada metal-binding domain-containing protein, partial [Steroidobacteraceae bacterium]
VFFLNEADAQAAGYRPCGACMPGSYARWKHRKYDQAQRT